MTDIKQMTDLEKYQAKNNNAKLNKTFMEKYAKHLMGDKVDGVFISLQHNSKKPAVSFKNITESKFKKSPYTSTYIKNGNMGIITGYKSKITVVDVDFMNVKKYGQYGSNEFHGKFCEDMLEFFNTYYVKTPNQGYHLYFKYEEDIKQTANINNTHVDIRNDGGYVVCPGSAINGKEYKRGDTNIIRKMPKQLKEWILKYQTMDKKEKTLTSKANIIKPNNTAYEAIIDNKTMASVLKSLPSGATKEGSFVGDYSKWFLVGKGCKWANCFEAFDAWSATTPYGNYDKEELVKLWDSWDCNVHSFLYVLQMANVKNTFTFKNTPNNLHVHKEINQGKIDDITGTKRFFKPNTNYLLKSGTGTGKTTAFSEYMKTEPRKFISIVSRVNLGVEQHRNFGESRNVKLYTDQNFRFGDNIIITPESCSQIASYDFSDYIIFMDEFNSIVEHILSSTTLNKRRKNTFFTIARMISTCSQFIAVDADISPISQAFVDRLKVEYKLVNNKFNNFKNKHVKFFQDEDKLLDKLRTESKFILCCDSKSTADTYFKLLNDPSIKLITSDTKVNIKSLSKYDKIIFSPKIVYGLDSQLSRPVYAVYGGQTITPVQMVQQLTRERQLTEINIFFPTPASQLALFDDNTTCEINQGELLQSFNDNYEITFDDYEDYENIDNSVYEDLFNHLHTQLLYKMDCLKTNPKLHLLKILKSRGFNVEYEILAIKNATSALTKELKAEIKEEKYENFSIEDEEHKDLNNILRIPVKKADKYKDLFLNQTELQHHFNYCSYFFQDIQNVEEHLRNTKEFNVVKMKGLKSKIVFFDKIEKMLKIKNRKPSTYKPIQTDIKPADKEYINTQYPALFKKKSSIKTYTDIYNMYTKGLRALCGSVGPTKKTQINNKRFQLLTLDDKTTKYHKKVYNYRHK